MSKAGIEAKAASLQVVVVPRQKHQRFLEVVQGISQRQCASQTARREWDCSTGNCFNLNVAFSLFVRLLKYKTSEELNMPRQELNVTFAADRPDLLGEAVFLCLCVLSPFKL